MREIKLSLETDVYGRGEGGLDVHADFDSSYNPEVWIWLQFDIPDEPWIKLTYREAAQLRDKLQDELGGWDKLPDANKLRTDKR